MTNPDLDLDLVRCFLAVAESGSFTQASRRLHLSQSAVSLKIQRLEALLGRDLFLRSSRSVTLTPEGDVLIGYGRRLLELSREMIREIARPALQGSLRLGVIQQFGHSFLPELLAAFKRQHPGVNLTVEVGMTLELLTAPEAEQFDLVLGAAGFCPPGGSGLSTFREDRVLLKEPLLWVEGEQGSTPGSPRETLPLILFSAPCSFRRTALELLEKAGRPWQIVYSSASLPSIQAAVQAGLGVSVLGRSSLLPGMKPVSPKACLPLLPDTSIALYSRKSPGDPLISSLAASIEEATNRWQQERPTRKPAKTRPRKRATSETAATAQRGGPTLSRPM